MKLPVLLFSALATVTALPRPAAADSDEAIAAIGGFIGGVIVGAHLDDHDDRRERHFRGDRHDRPSRHERYDRRDRRHHHDRIVIERGHRAHGYWTVRTVKVWVPGGWAWGVDDCGRRVRYRTHGHYDYRRERIWVERR